MIRLLTWPWRWLMGVVDRQIARDHEAIGWDLED